MKTEIKTVTDSILLDGVENFLRRAPETSAEKLHGKLSYSEYSACKALDSTHRIKYRHHCDEGVFTVEVESCNDITESYVVRFDSLDRLGGCINVIDEDNNNAMITTKVGFCGTQYYTADGWVYLTNRLHIFRSIDDEIYDYNSYPLSCEYEEMVRFEYDLQGVESLGDDNLKNGMSVRFWETIAYSNEINNLDFPIGQPIYFTMDWGNYTQGLNYAIKSCALKDKRIGEEYAMLEQGCVSTLTSTDRYSNFFTKTKTKQYFTFMAFSFPDSTNMLTLSCRIKLCVNNEKDCMRDTTVETCPSGYTAATGNSGRRKASTNLSALGKRKSNLKKLKKLKNLREI